MTETTASDDALILVVDDDWMSRELLQTHLESAGFRVQTASNGARALEMVAAHDPDLILLDVRMPDLSGFEVCARIKADPETRYTPVILATALDDRNSRVEGIQAGADDFVSKPFDGLTLITRCRSLLRIRALRRELLRRDQALHTLLDQHVDAAAARAILSALGPLHGS